MSWSAEELVKQLRYPPAYMDSSATALMRVAADMIDRLRAELATAQEELRLSNETGNWTCCLEAEAAIARVEELCDTDPYAHEHYVYNEDGTEDEAAIYRCVPERLLRAAIEGNQS